MTRLSTSAYLDHIASESARFRAVLAVCDPAAPVPACPEWDAADLLWHLAEVQWFWSRILETRPAGPEHLEHPRRPASYDGLLEAFDGASTALLAALGTADPREAAWSWAPEQTVGFTLRRQAHEALIHRLDAEQAAHAVTPLDPRLAADGVHECLDVMYGGCPPWGRSTSSGGHVRLDLDDMDVTLWVRLGRFTGTDPATGTHHDEDDLTVVDDPGIAPAAVVRGRAAAVDAWLWKRGSEASVTTEGDARALRSLDAVLGQPLD